MGYSSSLGFQKTFKRELEVENWIKKYDEEMGEKQVSTYAVPLEQAPSLDGRIPSNFTVLTKMFLLHQDELEMLEEQFKEENRQLKELDEKLEVYCTYHFGLQKESPI